MRDANPKAVGEPLLFSAELHPHRSLSRRGFLVVMAAIGVMNFGAGLIFLTLGAWPVVGFLVLGVALVWYAFRSNYRAARARETVLVTGSQVVVTRRGTDGIVARWRFNPLWVRLRIERDDDGAVTALALASRGSSLPVAAFLPTPDRTAFAAAFAAALETARRGG